MRFPALPLRYVVFLSAFVLLLFSFAHAESVQYSGTFPQLIYFQDNNTSQGAKCIPYTNSGYATITYNAQARDVSTGVSVCNATIPRGSRIEFEFIPHTSNDAYWFTTGFYSDSPYGDWIANAASPGAANICQEKNFINTGYATANTIQSWYGSLSVDPPDKSLSGLLGPFSSCTSPNANGSVTCTASAEGSATPLFNFGSTFGGFSTLSPRHSPTPRRA